MDIRVENLHKSFGAKKVFDGLSLEIPEGKITVILGGSGTILGPLFGTAIYMLLEEFLSRFWVFWQLPFGILLILVVLYARGGLVGILSPGRSDNG